MNSNIVVRVGLESLNFVICALSLLLNTDIEHLRGLSYLS